VRSLPDPDPDLLRRLAEIVGPDRLLSRPIHRIAYANDASFYRLVPQAIVRPRTISEIQALFELARGRRVPLTFRASGTSLSGQAISDGILADLSKDWKRMEVLEEGRRVRVEPGVIGAVVNQRLAPWRRKLGPDPASIHTCTIGGILANNSSGMCCGVARNSYHTVDSLTFVLPSGAVVDSADPVSRSRFEREEPRIVSGLRELREAVVASPGLVERIRRKYRIKNTTGYSINALVDFEHPVDILAHLMIGSEGTLGFIAEAVFRTVPDDPFRSTGLLFFPDVPAACKAIEPLRESGAATLELMDREALRSVEDVPSVPAVLRSLPEGAASLLVEYQAEAPAPLARLEQDARRIFAGLPLVSAPLFTREPAEQAVLWKVRRGIIASVGARRQPGTSLLIEDVAVPVEVLAPAVAGLKELFARYGYRDAVLFGHAKDGNLHFALSQSFEDESSLARYEGFMADLADLVARRFEGSLKAEHGTGRNMAPFVEAEWGAEAYGIMRRIKALVDPVGFLNPGVVLNDDPKAHVTHLKRLPPIEPEADRCIECGWCEPRCPSRNLTLTPRQRIVVQRQLASLRSEGSDPALLRALEADYDYQVLDTCAADGLCAVSCPVGIDTGALVKKVRAGRHGQVARWLSRIAASHFPAVERMARGLLLLGHAAEAVASARVVEVLAGAVSRASGGALPAWVRGIPRPAPHLPEEEGAREGELVYFPCCLTRLLASGSAEACLARVVLDVFRRAGVSVFLPGEAFGCCCGLPFSSRGFEEAAAESARRAVDRFWKWSKGGRRPVFTDGSSCALALKGCRGLLDPDRRNRFDRLRILDGIEAAQQFVLGRLPIGRTFRRVVVHPVCSAVKLDLVASLEAVVRSVAREVVVPGEAGCCGFAGDRGTVVPELARSATRAEACEVVSIDADGFVSSNRTCEIALAAATGRPYRSFWELLEEASRPDGGRRGPESAGCQR